MLMLIGICKRSHKLYVVEGEFRQAEIYAKELLWVVLQYSSRLRWEDSSLRC